MSLSKTVYPNLEKVLDRKTYLDMTEIVVDWDVKHQNKQKHARFLRQNNIKCFLFLFSEMKGFLIFFVSLMLVLEII